MPVFFYQHADSGWNAALLYNRIGKRIIGVGRSLGTAGNEVRVPDSYEMPRNAVDLSVSKKIGNLEIKVAVRDLLAEKVSLSNLKKLGMEKWSKLPVNTNQGVISI